MTNRCNIGRVTPQIDMFPDDVLVEIFDLYLGENPVAWQSLVHICRRWRGLVFAASRRLNVRIVCTLGTPVRDLLDVWPALPILVQGHIYETSRLDNIVTVLGQRNRVTGIDLWDFTSSQLAKVLTAMTEPFPGLTDLHLRAFDGMAPLDPDLFMGGSTPRLRYLQLERIPFTGLPKLLLSATHLVSLRLYDIPLSGYISPEAMGTCLSKLTSLETLCLEFRSLQSHFDWEGQRLPLPTRSVLPALMDFHFRGVGEYLEDLTSRVDAPRLRYVSVNFTHEIGFDNPQLSQFISRTPALRAPDEAHVIFDDSAGLVTLSSKTSGPGQFNVEMPSGALEWQLLALAQVCNLSLPPLSTVEDLYICENAGSRQNWDYPLGREEWLGLLKPFTSVKNLYLSEGLKQGIAPALRLLAGDRVTEVLPILESIFLEGPQPSVPYKLEEGIGQFISPAYPPNLYAQPWDSLGIGHEQDFTAPPPTPQFDWQNFSLEGPQPSGHFQEDIWHDPQDLRLDCLQPSGPLYESSEQQSSAQLPALHNIYSEEPQTHRPMPFQKGGWSERQNQNINLDLLLPPSEPLPQQHSSVAQEPALPNLLHSVESESRPQPSGSGPFQEGEWPDMQNLHLDWSQPSEELFHENFQYPSTAQSSTMQNLDSQDLQLPRPLQEGCWPDPQNFHLDGSHWQPAEFFQWEECIKQFAAARQNTAHPITISFWDRKQERVER